MSEILRELEEDLRNERLQKLWHSFGKLIIGFSIAIVLITATVVIWDNVQRSKATEMTSQLIRGADRIRVEDYQGAIQVFDALAGSGDNAYALLAMLRKASAQMALGDAAGAEAAYAQAGGMAPSGAAGAFSGLAALFAAGTAQEMTLPPEASPFIHSHTEQNAWRLLKEGEKSEAVQRFLALRDDKEAPRSLRQRAAMIVDYLAPESGRADATGHGG